MHTNEHYKPKSFSKIIDRRRSLSLAFFVSTGAELSHLFAISVELEYIAINCHMLTENSWEQVANVVRNLPKTKGVEFNRLSGGFPDWNGGWGGSFNMYGYVQDFLFDSGKTPFTQESTEQYLADCAANKEYIYPFGGEEH